MEDNFLQESVKMEFLRENVKIRKWIIENVKFENGYHYKMFFRIYYNLKCVLLSCALK